MSSIEEILFVMTTTIGQELRLKEDCCNLSSTTGIAWGWGMHGAWVCITYSTSKQTGHEKNTIAVAGGKHSQTCDVLHNRVSKRLRTVLDSCETIPDAQNHPPLNHTLIRY